MSLKAKINVKVVIEILVNLSAIKQETLKRMRNVAKTITDEVTTNLFSQLV